MVYKRFSLVPNIGNFIEWARLQYGVLVRNNISVLAQTEYDDTHKRGRGFWDDRERKAAEQLKKQWRKAYSFRRIQRDDLKEKKQKKDEKNEKIVEQFKDKRKWYQRIFSMARGKERKVVPPPIKCSHPQLAELHKIVVSAPKPIPQILKKKKVMDKQAREDYIKQIKIRRHLIKAEQDFELFAEAFDVRDIYGVSAFNWVLAHAD